MIDFCNIKKRAAKRVLETDEKREDIPKKTTKIRKQEKIPLRKRSRDVEKKDQNTKENFERKNVLNIRSTTNPEESSSKFLSFFLYLLIDLDGGNVPLSARANHSAVFPLILAADWLNLMFNFSSGL